ncbi:MAG: MSMEG_4193 family putative phosphomutase [Acidimicrobiales bacterium]
MPPRKRPPPPTLVLLVRHGQTPTTGAVLPGRAAGLHLSDVGAGQAQRAAERIAGLKKVAAVYASPLERTRETATPIAKACGLRVRRDAGLLECDFGEWTGQELKVLAKLPEWRTVQNRPSRFRFPGGESFAEMQLRMSSTVQRIAAAHRGETVVVVSHADPIKAAVAEAAGSHLDSFQRLVISPCSISALLIDDHSTTVLTVNSTGDDLTTLAPS